MDEKSRAHIESLDGLRGIAILLVFFFHYLPRNIHNPLSWFASIGWSGVDLFFVLSGFLITGILYDTRDSVNFFRVFYARRALRLLPLYVTAVSILLLTAAVLGIRPGWVAVPYYLYGANILLPVRGGVPNFTPYLQCIHFWSLALEEQFYSLWPVVVFFVRDRRKLMLVCLGGILAALLFRIPLSRMGAPTWVLYAQLPSRMDALLSGALLALALRGPNPEKWLSRSRLYALTGGGVLAVSLLAANARSLFLSSYEMTSWGYSVIACIYFGVLGLALVPGTIPNRVGRARVLRFFGRYSYGIYVWHGLPSPLCVSWEGWFIARIHPLVLGEMTYALTLLTLFTAIAVVSFHLLELPFLRLKSRFPYRGEAGGIGGQSLLQVAETGRLQP